MSAGSYLFLPPQDALRWFKVLAVFRLAAARGTESGFQLPPDRLPLRMEGPEGHPTILLVDDQDLLREAVGEYLTMQGYEVKGAASGAEGMRLIEEGLRPDLLICDVVLPDIHGTSFVREAQITAPDLKVLFISGYPPEVLRHQVGPMEFLQKPFRLDVLARRVRTLIAESAPS